MSSEKEVYVANTVVVVVIVRIRSAAASFEISFELEGCISC